MLRRRPWPDRERCHRRCGIHAGLLNNVPDYATMCYAGDVTVGVASSAVARDMASLAVAEVASLAGQYSVTVIGIPAPVRVRSEVTLCSGTLANE